MARTLRMTAELESLEPLLRFAAEGALELGAPPEQGGRIRLVLEELLVNVFSYAYDGAGEVEVECLPDPAGSARRLCVRLRDWGAPFDPLASPPPDLDADVESRPVGGLGILLAVEMADHVEYFREADANVLTACFDY